jgi:hypothetical protein
MARKSKKNTELGGVVGSTMETEKTNEALSGSDVVTLRVSLRAPHRFDDIPTDNGGTKSITLPSIDDNLRGQRNAILTPDGNAVFYQLSRSDWENIKAMYGDARMFKSYNGFPACVAEVSSLSDAKSGAYDDEIKATVTGYAPADPTALNVTEQQKGE